MNFKNYRHFIHYLAKMVANKMIEYYNINKNYKDILDQYNINWEEYAYVIKMSELKEKNYWKFKYAEEAFKALLRRNLYFISRKYYHYNKEKNQFIEKKNNSVCERVKNLLSEIVWSLTTDEKPFYKIDKNKILSIFELIVKSKTNGVYYDGLDLVEDYIKLYDYIIDNKIKYEDILLEYVNYKETKEKDFNCHSLTSYIYNKKRGYIFDDKEDPNKIILKDESVIMLEDNDLFTLYKVKSLSGQYKKLVNLTAWCTYREKTFEEYKKQLFLVFFKRIKQYYQIHQPSDQFKNVSDEEINQSPVSDTELEIINKSNFDIPEGVKKYFIFRLNNVDLNHKINYDIILNIDSEEGIYNSDYLLDYLDLNKWNNPLLVKFYKSIKDLYDKLNKFSNKKIDYFCNVFGIKDKNIELNKYRKKILDKLYKKNINLYMAFIYAHKDDTSEYLHFVKNNKKEKKRFLKCYNKLEYKYRDKFLHLVRDRDLFVNFFIYKAKNKSHITFEELNSTLASQDLLQKYCIFLNKNQIENLVNLLNYSIDFYYKEYRKILYKEFFKPVSISSYVISLYLLKEIILNGNDKKVIKKTLKVIKDEDCPFYIKDLLKYTANNSYTSEYFYKYFLEFKN